MGRSHRGLKICCGITTILLVSLLVVLIVLSLTIFKFREAKIITQPVSLHKLELVLLPLIELDAQLGISVTVDNHNYGSFKYKNSTVYVSYHGNVVAEAPIDDDTIPARKKKNISTTLNVMAGKEITDQNFLADDLEIGILNFTSTTNLQGKVSILKLLKKKATSFVTCDVSVFIKDKNISSVCKSKTKF